MILAISLSINTGILEKLEHFQIKNATFTKVQRLLHEIFEQIVCIVNNVILGHHDAEVNILIERLEFFEIVILAQKIYLLLADLDNQVLFKIFEQFHSYSKRGCTEANEQDHRVFISSPSIETPK